MMKIDTLLALFHFVLNEVVNQTIFTPIHYCWRHHFPPSARLTLYSNGILNALKNEPGIVNLNPTRPFAFIVKF